MPDGKKAGFLGVARQGDAMEIRLEKIDPESNCFRFYLIRCEPDLFGCAALVLQWGRIGGAGRTDIRASGSPERVREICERMVQRKLRRGYAVAGAGLMPGAAVP